MTWETFWLPNIIQATLFATLAALVGVLVRRWARGLFPLLEQIFGEQQQTKELAKTAAVHSIEAVDQARAAAETVGRASESAQSAANSAQQTNEAVVWLATELGKANERSEVLAEKTNRLVAALAVERARQPVDDDNAAALTTTGKHRLHTALIDTGAISATQDDLYETERD